MASWMGFYMIKQALDAAAYRRSLAKEAKEAKEAKGAAPCPGSKIRSEGRGRGLGFGQAKGPVGVPGKKKKWEPEEKATKDGLPCPGSKIRSGGRGRGMGFGRGKGPVGDPGKKLDAATKKGGKIGQRARFAEAMKGIRSKKGSVRKKADEPSDFLSSYVTAFERGPVVGVARDLSEDAQHVGDDGFGNAVFIDPRLGTVAFDHETSKLHAYPQLDVARRAMPGWWMDDRVNPGRAKEVRNLYRPKYSVL